MLISNSQKFCFFHIEKTAGSAISLALAPFCEHVQNKYNETHERLLEHNTTKFKGWQKDLHITKYQHHNVSEHIHEVPQDYFTFCFVRHPIDRFHSYYCSVKSLHPDMPFTDILESGMLTPQYVRIDAPLTFIGKYENLQEDWKYVSEKLNINLHLPTINKTIKKRVSFSSYEKNLIARKYANDFVTFGYVL